MRRIWFFAISIVLLGVVWAQIETPDLKVPDLPDVPKKIISIPTDTLSVPELPSVPREFFTVPIDTFLQIPHLPETGSRDFEAPQMVSLEIPRLPTIEPQTFKIPESIPLDSPNLPGTVWENVLKVNDFRGGLDLVSAKTKIAPNCAVELENALWNPQGEMYKRPGCSEHSTPPFIPNFLYAYYKQTGEKYTMGGSDTALYFWHEDSSGDGWTYLTGTEGTSGRWDGTTFEDLFVGTHEGIVPVVWNGSTLVTMGTSLDSFRVITYTNFVSDTSDNCVRCSTEFVFDSSLTGWDTNDWEGYTIVYTGIIDTADSKPETLSAKALVTSNSDNKLFVQKYASPIIDTYATINSWFQIDSVWREGTLDSIADCVFDTTDYTCHSYCITRIFDSDFTWNFESPYENYVFEVTGGKGEGFRAFLPPARIYRRCCAEDTSLGSWDSTFFYLTGLGGSRHDTTCFDSTTTYKIYAVKFWTGSKFVENFDGSLWLGWTGTGDEQEKNVVVWSETDDLGNWPSGNYIVIESDDGDFITGMAKFPGEYTDVPRQEMIVTKNNSLYKIVPSGDSYAFWLITRGVGGVSNSAISPAEGLLLFPDQHGVWAYDKIKPTCISLKIDPIFEAWDLENSEDVSAIYNQQDRTYYLSYPGFYGGEYPGGGFITVFVMDSAQVKDGYWTHSLDSAGNETGDDNWEFWEEAGSYVGIAAKSDGEYAIMFKKSSGATGFKVFLAFFDEDGDQIGDTLRIDTDSNLAYAKDADHKLDMNSAGQIIACWTDRGDGNDDICCQYVDFDTGLVDENFFVNSDSSTNTDDYVFWGVGINEGGVCVVVWQDMRENLEALVEIYGQRFQYSDSLIGSNFRVNNCWKWVDPDCVPCTNGPDDGPVGQCAYNENKPAVAVGSNTFVVTWIGYNCTGATCLYKRAFDIDGTPREDEQKLSDCAGGNVQEPSISMNSRGNYAIAYDKECAEDDYAIYLMAFNSADVVQLSETLVSDTDSGGQGPDVSINNLNVMTVVWYDARDPAVEIAYRSYDWSGALMASDSILSSSAYCGYPEIDCFLSPPDTGTYTLAWNIDHHGWSRETFVASAYCYQHSIFDDVKILFADEERACVCYYGTQADDVNDAVILTYQGPWFEFTEHPSFVTELEYITLEASLDSGAIYVLSYRDYSQLISEDTIQCGGDCRHELTLPDVLGGKNISVKIITGTEIDTFYLSGYTIETITEKSRK